ncbi:Imm49 family immunity protein [Kitasatospora aureofaciens]|uniref:Imm49 family immunity protein n=1 Tax=Kitasatospora aureofaciens TaxID=1894 RepID=UPI0027DEFE56|nr:Imm49 family immunity protein [Kitasatospora aureofaciens]
MRIERHQVGEPVLSATRTDFMSRIGRQVRAASKGTRMDSREWQFIADMFLEYLGALSAGTPALDGPEARAVLADATEAAAGAVAYAVYYGYDRFQISLDYVNFGMSYGIGEADEGEERSRVTSRELIDAFCLVILSDQAVRHGEAVSFARDELGEGAGGDPAVELVSGLLIHVLNYVDDETYPPSAQQKLAAVDAALDRIRQRAEQSGEGLRDHPYSVGLRTLRALVAEDREAFDDGLTALLLAHRAAPGTRPDSLLPLLPLALSALAYRGPGWTPAVDTDYLPRALVAGFEASDRRL